MQTRFDIIRSLSPEICSPACIRIYHTDVIIIIIIIISFLLWRDVLGIEDERLAFNF